MAAPMDGMIVPAESWPVILGFLSIAELCRFAGLSAALRAEANNDDLWSQHCRRRWAGKQRMPFLLFRNGNYDHLRLSVPEMKCLLRRRGVDSAHMIDKSELAAALSSSNPLVLDGAPLPIPSR